VTAAQLVDSLAEGRVLVFGSPPPGGRDLDLLVRPADAETIAAGLAAEGFDRSGAAFARFRDCTVEAVDVVPAAEWAIEPAELEALYAEALPLDGFERLVRPAPHHALLVAARRFALGRGVLSGKLRARVDAALAEDPAAFETARARAAAWRAERALALLEAAHRGNAPRRVRRRLPRLPRTTVVAFSGLDGAGKSSQAEALVETLGRLGIDAEAVWSPLGGHPLQALVGRGARLVLRRAAPAPGAAGSMSDPGRRPSAGRTAWAAFGAVLNAVSQRAAVLRRPGRVVVLDRQALDTIVRMRFLYGTGAARRLVIALAPRPRFAYFLDIRAETSLARKDDIWELADLQRHADLYGEELPRLGVRRLDGEAPREQLCAAVAREVWAALSADARRG
jgi:thymidylate kinase